MKKRLLALLLTVALAVSCLMLAGSAAADYEPLFLSEIERIEHSDIGSGSKEIKTVEDLMNINEDLSGSYVLMNDIVVDRVWEPLGEFSGRLNGNGYTISGIYADEDNLAEDEDGVYFGLFSKLDYGSITNLGIINSKIQLASIDERLYAGFFAGSADNNSGISNCFVDTSSIDISLYGADDTAVGSIVGYCHKAGIGSCYSTAPIESTIYDGSHHYYGGLIGGVVRGVSGTISGCFNTGDITVRSSAGNPEGVHGENGITDVDLYIGGLCGEGADVSYCYNGGDIEVNSSVSSSLYDVNSCPRVGGLVGDGHDVFHSYNYGDIQVYSSATSTGTLKNV